MTPAFKHLKEALEKHGTIYPETLQLAETQERINLIQAYFAGAIAMQKKDVDVDAFLNQFNQPNDTTTPTSPVSA